MASKSKTATVGPSYVEFEPYCEWKKEEGADAMVLHLPDFKKDQLRVQVSNQGVLKVSGERPVNEDGTKRNRFVKETKLPQECDINDIRAKFRDSHLHVIIPKKATPQVPEQQQKPATTSPKGALESKVDQKPKEEAPASKAEKLKAPSSRNGKTGTSYDQPKDDQLFTLGDALGRSTTQKKVNLGLGVAVAAIVAIGAYVAYKYGSSSSDASKIQQ